jgi:hypothetical protein
MSGTTLTGPAPVFTQQIRGYRKAQIRPGDSPERIAQRELGDATQWYVLVNLNGLQPPWITDDPAQAVPGKVLLSAQDYILVPTSSPPASGVVETPNVFGRDLLVSGGRITAGPNGDCATIADIANLKQALELRLGCRTGELVYHPDYGNRAWYLLGRGNTPIADQLAAGWIARACKADPRISSASVTASTQGDALVVTGTAVTVDGKRLPVGIPSAGV